MRSRADSSSPWGRRLYFEDREFDEIADEQFAKHGSVPFELGRGVDVDRLLMAVQELEADYVDLPERVLGRTRFGRDGRCAVELSRALADRSQDDAMKRRRLRTTLAHEYGHVLCHRVLFIDPDLSGSLFRQDTRPHPESILCRDEHIGMEWDARRYGGEWWEYQANQLMAALLLPRELFAQRVGPALEFAGLSQLVDALRATNGGRFFERLGNDFDVNPVVVKYRLQSLGLVPRDRNQSTLAFG